MLPDVPTNTTPRGDPTLPPVGRMPSSPSEYSPWRGWSLLLRLLGLAVACVGGGALSIPSPLPLGVWVLQPVVLGLLAAVLLRSWWSLLSVPVAFVAGLFVGNAYQMHGFDLQGWFTGGFIDIDILLLLAVPLVIGVAIGTLIGYWIELRMGLR